MAIGGLILGWAFGKAADKGLRKFKRFAGYDELLSDLKKGVNRWSKTLPKDAYVMPEVFFAKESTYDKEFPSPVRQQLQNTL
ncbi:MAG: hypothetical protein ACYS67_20400, partial [Planctomycetota bacterium]